MCTAYYTRNQISHLCFNEADGDNLLEAGLILVVLAQVAFIAISVKLFNEQGKFGGKKQAVRIVTSSQTAHVSTGVPDTSETSVQATASHKRDTVSSFDLAVIESRRESNIPMEGTLKLNRPSLPVAIEESGGFDDSTFDASQLNEATDAEVSPAPLARDKAKIELPVFVDIDVDLPMDEILAMSGMQANEGDKYAAQPSSGAEPDAVQSEVFPITAAEPHHEDAVQNAVSYSRRSSRSSLTFVRGALHRRSSVV